MTAIPTDPIDSLIDLAQTLPTSAVPASVLAFQRKRILDNLGCIAAGYDSLGNQAAIALATRWSGVEEATLLGTSTRLAAPQAAFVNSIRARALDFCDVISPGWHPSSSDIPVALAMGELTGANGQDILAALAIGQDIAQRINMAAQANGFFYRGFDSNVLGLFSGSIIAARLLKLNRDMFANAVGLAFDFGIGTFQHYQDKVLAVRVGQGLVAKHAIEAAMMAQAGVSGSKRLLGGENGFFNLYAPGVPDLSQLTNSLGEQFLGEEATCFKMYPHCSILLALTETLLNSPECNTIDDVGNCHITLSVSHTMRMVCGAEFAPSHTPDIDAQFSARYIVANALVRKKATPAEFTAKAAIDPVVYAIAQRITLHDEPLFTRFDQCEVTITSAKGKTIKLTAAYGKGWPENPLDQQQIRDKFLLCCSLSANNNFKIHAIDIAAQVDTLDNAASLTPLLTLLTGVQTY